MKPRDSGLFDLDDSAPAEKQTAPNPMTARQRQTIRELFAQIGVVDARAQFDIVAELTGVRITSVAELEVGPANVLIQMLRGRAARSGHVNTGTHGKIVMKRPGSIACRDLSDASVLDRLRRRTAGGRGGSVHWSMGM